jgi:nicotinamide-nucleotide adenylyltransferase
VRNVGKRALTISRFQPFHIGHYETVKKIKNDGYEEIIIGIGSAEKSYRPDNPFTCSERIEMIYPVVSKEGFKNYFIVPITDIDDFDLWAYHVERLVPRFDAVYSGNPLAAELFSKAGYEVVQEERKTITDFKKPVETIKVSGTKIREMIIKDDQRWRNFVPPSVYDKIIEFEGVERIKKLYSMLYQE